MNQRNESESFGQLLVAIRSADPGAADRLAPRGFDLDALLDEIVATPFETGPSHRSIRRRPVRHRRGVVVVSAVVAVVALATGAAAYLMSRSASNPAAPVACRSGVDAGSPAAVVSATGDPVDDCREAWLDGLVPGAEPGVVPEELTACVTVSGEVEVFPAGPTVCTELGLAPWAPPNDDTAAVGALQERLTAATLDTCASFDEIERLATSTIAELGLRGWTVVRATSAELDGMCPAIGIDPVARQVVVAGALPAG